MRTFLRICSVFIGIACFCSSKLEAQEFFQIKVIDAKSKIPLPFVTLVFQPGGQAFFSDVDGQFSIPAQNVSLNSAVKISYLGYDGLDWTTEKLKAQSVIFLQPKLLELGEVKIIPGENPAHRIIRKAVSNKKTNDPEGQRVFIYTSYNKTIITPDLKRNVDSLIQLDSAKASKLEKIFAAQHLLLIETVSERKFMNGRNSERIIANRMSGFKESPFALLGSGLQSYSFYSDEVELLGYKFLNPISKGSTSRYLFILEDSIIQNKDTVFVISFRPRKGARFYGLQGVLHIHSDGYAINHVIAEPGDINQTEGLKIKIQQNYEKIDGKYWAPVQLNTDWIWTNLNLKVDTKEGESEAGMKAISRSYIKNIRFDTLVKKKDFSEVELSYDPNATRRDDAYWNQFRQDSLSAKDRKTYQFMDSIGTLAKFDKKVSGLEALLSGKWRVKKIDIDLDKLIVVNQFEYIRPGLSLHTNERLIKWLSLGAYAGYGFGDKAWKYSSDINLQLNKRAEWWISGQYSKDISEAGGTRFLDDKKGLSNMESLRDFYLIGFDGIKSYSVTTAARLFRYLRFSMYAKQSIRNSPYGFGRPDLNGIYSENYSYTVNEIGWQGRYQFREKFIQLKHFKISQGSAYPVLWFNYSIGLNQNWFNKSGDFAFHKVDFKLNGQYRFLHAGVLRYSILGGKVIGDIPYGLLYNNHGSFIKGFTISPDNAFETMGTNEFASDQFAAVFISHNFGRIFPLNKKFNPEFMLVHNAGWGTLKHPDYFFNIPIATIDKGFFESGLRINKLIKNGITGMGIGTYYRYGAYAFPDWKKNLAVKLTLSMDL